MAEEAIVSSAPANNQDGGEIAVGTDAEERQQQSPEDGSSKKIYTAGDREALAKELLPPDVIHYLKEEFRAEFTGVRDMKDRKLY